MHINHKAGDKMYIEYAEETLELIDRQTGEITEEQFFVAILRISQYTYPEATLSQDREDLKAIHPCIHDGPNDRV
jgi:hypothetical protein